MDERMGVITRAGWKRERGGWLFVPSGLEGRETVGDARWRWALKCCFNLLFIN